MSVWRGRSRSSVSPQLRRILAFGKMYWPHLTFFREQEEMIESVALDLETYVVAANKVGKDYTAAFISLTFFMAPQLYFPDSYVEQIARAGAPNLPEHLIHTRRIMTTSVQDGQLDVLWGEIERFYVTSAIPLDSKEGGLFVLNHHEIRLANESNMKSKNPLNYLKGRVAKQGESMAGAHAAYTLFVADEASGIPDEMYEQAQGWAKRKLIFGNPNDCNNFFRRGVEGGTITA